MSYAPVRSRSLVVRGLVTAAITVSAALVPVTVGAGSADAATLRTWNRLAQCESSGRWHINTGNGYYGGVQFSGPTWVGYGGRKFARIASRATKAEQIKIAEKVRRSQGWGAWPVCSRKLGLG
ncbi:MAG: transglycosylase family protein [Nocardioidaceae bacterium]